MLDVAAHLHGRVDEAREVRRLERGASLALAPERERAAELPVRRSDDGGLRGDLAASRPLGSSTNSFQEITASCALLVGPAVKEPPSTGSPVSRAISRRLAPAGTVTLIAYMSRGSRCQVSCVPLARIVMPTSVSSGPVGPCSPGIHLGNTRVSGPGLTARERSVCTRLRAISRASTRTVRSAAWAAPVKSSAAANIALPNCTRMDDPRQ